jgi:hypothetical protein
MTESVSFIHYQPTANRLFPKEINATPCNGVVRRFAKMEPPLGEETFPRELPAQTNERMGAEHCGEERSQTAEAIAEQIIAVELKRWWWKEAALKTRPRDPAKAALAARLRPRPR